MPNTSPKKELSEQQQESLLQTLQTRFAKNPQRHKGLTWDEVQHRLKTHPHKLWSLQEMENTGGEPDVLGKDEVTNEFLFFDCSVESPKGRRSICYDLEGLQSRKDHPPKNNALNMASEMGIKILTEQQYRQLQLLGEFDTKTSSWILTPPDIRAKGGALFCDFRYGHVFVYHNGAQSYYGVRGFRGVLRV